MPAPLPNFDARGMESVPYDLHRYLQRLGPDAALKTFDEFARATAAQGAFEPGGVLHFMHSLPQFVACLRDPSAPPDLSDFIALKARYLQIVDEVFARERLDGLVFPQMRAELPQVRTGTIQETTVGELNIAGLPAVTMPAGYYRSGAPFGPLFLGRQWSEPQLLAQAYAYEVGTCHRRPPSLKAGAACS